MKYPYMEVLKSAGYDYELSAGHAGDWTLCRLLHGSHRDAQVVKQFKTRAAGRKFFNDRMCHECGRSDLD